MSADPATAARPQARWRIAGALARWPSLSGVLRLAGPFLIALVVYSAALGVMWPTPNGDEPHYALEAYSIARDGDRDMTRDYLDAERLSWVYGDWPLEPHAYRFRPGGPLVSYHGVGLALLLAPVAAVARGWAYLRAEMVIIAALAAAVLLSILRIIAPGSRRGRWSVWAIVMFSWPLLAYSNAIYPEVPAALAVLVAVRALVAPRFSSAWIGAAMTCASFLPFLHARYLPLALGIAVAVLVRTIRDRRRRRWGLATGLAAALIPAILAATVFAYSSARWYGSPLPSAPLRATYGIPGPPANATVAPPACSDGGCGGESADAGFDIRDTFDKPIFQNFEPLFDSPTQGWLPYAPWGLVALAATLALVLRRRLWVAGAVLAALAYLGAIAASAIDIGAAYPGRFAIVFLPLLAIPMLYAVRSSRLMAGVTLALGALAAGIAVGSTLNAERMYADMPPQEAGIAAALTRPWRTGEARAAATGQPPERSRSVTPPLRAGPAGVVRDDGRDVTATSKSAASTGVIAMTKPRRPRDGEWLVVFPIGATGGLPLAPGDLGALRVDIGGRTYLRERFDRRLIRSDGTFLLVARRFRTRPDLAVTAAVESFGRAQLAMGRPWFMSQLATPTPSTPTPSPSPAPLDRWHLWAIVVVVLAATIVVAQRRQARGRAVARARS